MQEIMGFLIGAGIMGIVMFIILRSGGKISKAEKSDVIRWFNATHAVLLWINGKNILTYGGLTPTNKARKIEQESLKQWWDIEDESGFNDTVEWLLKEGHRRGQIEDIGAWDYSRAMSLLSSSYLIGYISREEALDRSLEIAKFIQSKYSSWDEFINSYLKGYEIWSNESGDERRAVYNKLKSMPNSLYNLPWNLELKKEW